MENTISIEIPADVVAAVVNKFSEIEAILKPYIIHLPEGDKDGLLRVGEKNISFIDKAEGYSRTAPEFNPGYLDVPEFRRDKNALDALNAMFQPSLQVMTILEETMSLAANDSYAGALAYYSSVRESASRGIIKAKPIYEDLSKRFVGRLRQVSPSSSNPTNK
jgi:hypothetical protein